MSYETITFEAAGDVTNAERQTLAVVRYHQVVRRKSNDEVFHDQVGYWTWDASGRPLSAIRAMADLGQSSDPLGPSYDENGIPLVPGYIEVVAAGDPLAGAADENVVDAEFEEVRDNNEKKA